MSIDPKISFWFGVYTSILLGIATGAVHLPNTVPESLAASITSWCAFFGWINSMILTALNGYSSQKSGPLVSVPAAAVKMMLIAAIALSGLLWFTGTARAGDIASPLVPLPPVKALAGGSPCTPTSCSGWYVGAGLGGIGTNLDIIGQGLNGSAFAGGMLPTTKFGYLYAQSGWLFGAEATLAYQTNTTATVAGTGGNQNGLLFTQGVKFGGNFSALFGQTQSPITIPPTLANALINIYAQAGAAEHQLAGGFASGAYSGAGVLFDVGPHSFIDVDYKNIQYGATKSGTASFNSENVITASFNYKF